MNKPPDSTLTEWNRLAAEKEGWTDLKPCDTCYSGWVGKAPAESPRDFSFRAIPDYAHDLNETHRLEMGLDDLAYQFWGDRLESLCLDYDQPLLSTPAWVRLRAWLEVKGVEVKDAE